MNSLLAQIQPSPGPGKALGQAERWGIVPRNVARLVSPPGVPKANTQPLSPVEAKKLLAAIRGDRLEALYTVALAVGLRQGEALGPRCLLQCRCKSGNGSLFLRK